MLYDAKFTLCDGSGSPVAQSGDQRRHSAINVIARLIDKTVNGNGNSRFPHVVQ